MTFANGTAFMHTAVTTTTNINKNRKAVMMRKIEHEEKAAKSRSGYVI